MEILKKTKIVATIGPATESEEMLTKLASAGLNVGRLNFSHGDFEEHQKRVDTIRKVSSKLGTPLAILQDLAGPKIRIGDFGTESGRVTLVPGKFFTLTTDKLDKGDENRVHVNYPELHNELKKGGFVMLDDGKKKLEVVEIKGKEIKCKVLVGGDTKGRRGVNLPGAYLKISSITDKDKKDLQFGIKNKVDFMALSFVRKPEDVAELRDMLKKAKCEAAIISKIETPEAVENIDAIIELSDGIMIARGDLAIEVPAEDVPLIQKMIIKKCNAAGKPVITATQMLESMIKLPVPTRAEVSDVANAMLDGTDAVMLSEETTLGEYPVEAVGVMTRIARRIEGDLLHKQLLFMGEEGKMNVTDSVTGSAVRTAERVGAKFVVSLTESGRGARKISRYKPHQDILVFTPNKVSYQRSILNFGCTPFLIDRIDNPAKAIEVVRECILKNKLAKKGDKVVIATGVPFGKTKETNVLLVNTL
jgi:pyruvate kinase